jgi:hypothetical protein
MADDRQTYRLVATAVEQWYTVHYPLGVRLTFSQRASLTDTIAHRLGVAEMPNEDELPDALLAMAQELGQCPALGCVCVSGHTGDHYLGERTA